MTRLQPKFKLWMFSEGREGVMGDGKMHLLTHIDRLGSLSAAAKVLKISYRKAWGDIRKAEDCLGRSLVEKVRGGADGGRTLLTDFGRKLVEEWKVFHDEVEESVSESFERFCKRLKK